MTPVKDRSILDLLARLDLSSRNWMVVDHWDADLFAVGVSASVDARRLIYISTFEQDEGSYYYECEVASGPELTDYTVIDSSEGVDYETLTKIMERHLGSSRGA